MNMLPELGHFALCIALSLAIIQASIPVAGVLTNRPLWMRAARPAAIGQFGFLLLAFLILTYSFIVSDFSVSYVAHNSNTSLPLQYRISAVWGAHEGSLLLWVLMLAGWTLAVAVFSKALPRDMTATVLSVMGMVSIGFLLFMLLTSNPFDRQFPAPAEGRDLNPLLQDFGLVIHPPMLYMGYVGFSVAFAFAIAALISGRLDTAWARWTRPWTTSAWMFLTLGIMLGSWWAYHELGWGGWWFWDPVENASFMPWLVGTALIHSLAVTEKRGIFKSWTVLLAITAFSLSLLGTFLVRSGVLVSVHAFATDPARGVFILAFFAVVVGGSLVLYAWRAPRFKAEGKAGFFSREGFLLLNNIFLVVAATAVFVGTLYPLLADALALGKLSVGAPYFNTVFVPLTLPLVLLVIGAASLNWKRGNATTMWQRLRWVAVLAVLTAIVFPFILIGQSSLIVAAALMLAFGAIYSAMEEIYRRGSRRGYRKIPLASWGMSMAHIGLGVFVIGVTLVSTYSAESDVRLAPGDSTELSGFSFRFDGISHEAGPNYDSTVGKVTLSHENKVLAVLRPEKRIYRAMGNSMTEAGVLPRLHRDLYVSLGEPLSNGAWSLRLYYRPFMRFVWLGAIFMALGGLIAIFDKRYRHPKLIHAQTGSV